MGPGTLEAPEVPSAADRGVPQPLASIALGESPRASVSFDTDHPTAQGAEFEEGGCLPLVCGGYEKWLGGGVW